MSIKKAIQSFENTKSGFSGRKLTAFWSVVIVATSVSFKYTDANTVFEIVCAWLMFASLCLGLVTAQNIIELKKGSDKEQKEDKRNEDLPPNI